MHACMYVFMYTYCMQAYVHAYAKGAATKKKKRIAQGKQGLAIFSRDMSPDACVSRERGKKKRGRESSVCVCVCV